MKRNLPNVLTCLNLLCGCLALTFILGGSDLGGLVTAAYFVAVAAVADFFDGLAARALRVSSPIGKDLDSLADMVSFGVVPGALSFRLIELAINALPGMATGSGPANSGQPTPVALLAYAGFLITIFSALRLAKFNNDTRQTTSFIGLPTPACTLVVASLPLILRYDEFGLDTLILNPWVLLGLTVVLSGLLVAELPLFALKFKNFRWLGNRRRFIFVGLALGLVGWLRAAGVPLAVLLYVLLSVPGRVRSRELAESGAAGPQ